MARVRVATSSSSIAGNSAIRSWLRPSLRYDSVSRIPLARNAAASCRASTPSKSMVAVTWLRSDGLATNGVA